MRLRDQLCRIKGEQAGVAYLEFALVLPILMLLFLGGLELTRYVQTAQKVDKLTHTIVDLVAQAPTISENELGQIMIAVQHIMSPLEFGEDGVMIVSCVGYDSNNQLIVKWQYKGGGSLARNSVLGGSGLSASVPAGFTIDTRDNVIIAETFYKFEPMINEQYVSPIEFYRTAYYMPRLGELDTLATN